MATTKMTRQWRRWAGPIGDIERATRLALEIIGQRTRTEPPCEIEIALPQRVTTADNPDALQTQIDTRDLDLIRSIRINVGSKRGLRATIHVEREAPALTIEVVGEDRTLVEGLTSQLEELLRKGKQRIGNDSIQGGIFILVLVLTTLAGVSILGAIDRNGQQIDVDTPAEYVILLLTVVGGIGSVYAVSWLLPDLQLLRPGERTRLRRFRLAVMAFVGSLIVSIMATVIYEAVT
jgi:hypothetical protein